VQVSKIQRRGVGHLSRSAKFGAECNGVFYNYRFEDNCKILLCDCVQKTIVNIRYLLYKIFITFFTVYYTLYDT